jgi:hypothetical protein
MFDAKLGVWTAEMVASLPATQEAKAIAAAWMAKPDEVPKPRGPWGPPALRFRPPCRLDTGPTDRGREKEAWRS